MDFALTHIHEDSVATKSNVRHIPVSSEGLDTGNESKNENEDREPSLEELLVEEANIAATNLLLGTNKTNTDENVGELVDSAMYPERMTPQSETIRSGSLVVIFESFDNLKFCYAEKGKIFSNRNGNFHHDDFIGKPYGCKIRSRNNHGFGFCFLLKPTPELWSCSLNHRTQIIHFLDASMIVFYLDIRPNMIVCESGTGSGALSHCIMRSIAPKGMLHTYEFNQNRAEQARLEFTNNGVSNLVEVHHKDVCGKHGLGGFDRPQHSVDAIVLDLPEPWSAVPYAAHCIKPNSRLVSYSPCVEQSQRTVVALKSVGFHSIKTMEFRLKENYVDEVEYEMPPKEKRPRFIGNRPHKGTVNGNENNNDDCELDKSDNDKTTIVNDIVSKLPSGKEDQTANTISGCIETTVDKTQPATEISKQKKKKFLVARPFPIMRGHTAFLTFATAGNKAQPFPN